jgi:hypothetical protein
MEFAAKKHVAKGLKQKKNENEHWRKQKWATVQYCLYVRDNVDALRSRHPKATVSKIFKYQFAMPSTFTELASANWQLFEIWNMPPRAISLFSSRIVPTLCRRSYSTAPRVSLAFDLHEPAKPSSNAPGAIIFMHGLFGSKKNNRSISKWAHFAQLLLKEFWRSGNRALARDLGRPIYAVVSSTELFMFKFWSLIEW